MDSVHNEPLRGVRRFLIVFLSTIFVSLHYASVLYINSSYLGQFFSRQGVSLLFVLAALINIGIFLLIPRLLTHFGRKGLLLTFLSVEAISIGGMALSRAGVPAAVFFVLFAATLPMIYYCLDIFLEDISTDKHTGEIRGLYLTSINIAIAVAPLAVAGLASTGNFTPVYLLSFALLLPVFLLLPFLPKPEKPNIHYTLPSKLPFRKWFREVDIRRTTIARFVLEFFYALMVIYTPIYLSQIIGFGWDRIGVMFTIMLLPFIFLQWPIGEIADRWLGEKEIMTAGFFITGISLLLMPFLGMHFWGWTGALFLSRVGASLIEVTAESHFFKRVSGHDNGLISIFRLARASGIITGAIVGGLIVAYMPFNNIFFFLALAVLLGMKESAFITDTK